MIGVKEPLRRREPPPGPVVNANLKLTHFGHYSPK